MLVNLAMSHSASRLCFTSFRLLSSYLWYYFSIVKNRAHAQPCSIVTSVFPILWDFFSLLFFICLFLSEKQVKNWVRICRGWMLAAWNRTSLLHYFFFVEKSYTTATSTVLHRRRRGFAVAARGPAGRALDAICKTRWASGWQCKCVSKCLPN